MSDRFELQDEIQALQDIENYNIQNDHDPNSEDMAALLEGK
jgi:condensin complex subunit 1